MRVPSLSPIASAGSQPTPHGSATDEDACDSRPDVVKAETVAEEEMPKTVAENTVRKTYNKMVPPYRHPPPVPLQAAENTVRKTVPTVPDKHPPYKHPPSRRQDDLAHGLVAAPLGPVLVKRPPFPMNILAPRLGPTFADQAVWVYKNDEM